MEKSVTVWGKPYVVSLDHKSRTVWIASGIYLGQYLRTGGSSPSSALKAWGDAAKYKGD